MAKLVRTVCSECDRPLRYQASKKVYIHLYDGCDIRNPKIKMITIRENF